MIQSDQLGDFKQTTRDQYEEISAQGETENLYIHKTGFPNVMVRAPKAYKKIHCWRLKTLEITQFGEKNGTREKAVASIEFDGELIFTLLDLFNQMMGRQILEYVDNITAELRLWCGAPIKNVFLLKERTDETLGFKHGFIEITPQLFYTDKSHYFEYRCWRGEVESEVPEIEVAEQVEGTSSYTGMFEHICQKIQRYKKVKKLAMQRKKKKALEKQEEQLWRHMGKNIVSQGSYLESEMPSNQYSRHVQFDQ